MANAESVTIKISIGNSTVECSGTERFVLEELEAVVKGLVATMPASMRQKPTLGGGTGESNQSPDGVSGTTATLASQLNAKSGTDLAEAAAAHLTFVLQRGVWDRAALLSEMRSANHHYKASYARNLSSYLKTLMSKGFFIETSRGVYSLSEKRKRELLRALQSG